VLLPAHWVRQRAPGATVAVFPSDHLIVEAEAFMDQVAAAAAYVEENPGRIVLLGAQATEPEPEYGWIEPGPVLRQMGKNPIRAVRRFIEKEGSRHKARSRPQGRSPGELPTGRAHAPREPAPCRPPARCAIGSRGSREKSRGSPEQVPRFQRGWTRTWALWPSVPIAWRGPMDRSLRTGRT
jgi:hypothetical protein